MATRDAGDTNDARRRHYGVFYGLEPCTAGTPLAVVHGNCQAESLRVALRGEDLQTARIPPVHELTGADLPHLSRLLARASIFITQPVRDGYHELPLGSGELKRALSSRVEVLVVPVIRYAGLYPTQAIVRPPSDRSLVPPLIPYHDLGTLLEAAGRPKLRRLDVCTVRAVARQSLQQLRARESAHGALALSDLFATPSFVQMRTINHPGNPVWEAVAGRVRAALGLRPAEPLDRDLLASVHAPRSAEVIAAFGLEDTEDPCWYLDGEPVDPDAVRTEHLGWYARHPDAVSEGLRRHAEVLSLLTPSR
jgi:hypothetical protein